MQTHQSTTSNLFRVFTIALILLVSNGCSNPQEEKEPQKVSFEVDSQIIDLDYAPSDIIHFDNGYLARVNHTQQDSIQLVYFNHLFEIQEEYTRKLNEGVNENVIAIWCTNDTLYSIIGLGEYHIAKWNNRKWEILSKNGMTRENYMEYEQNLPIFEDEKFIVSSCCRGEFGGAIYFREKQSNRIFSCPSTCLSGIQKINEVYYITSSLAHMSLHSSVIRIEDPTQLYELKDDSLIRDCNWYDIYSDDPKNFDISHPQGYNKGYDTMIDTFEVFIVGSFEYQNKPYYLYSDVDNAYVGKIINDQLTTIDTIYNKPLWSHGIRDLMNNTDIIPIRSRKMNGLVQIANNTIRIFEFK